MLEERIREALKACVGWSETYDDWMGGEDFKRRDEDVAWARALLAGRDCPREEIAAEVARVKAEQAAKAPKITVAR